MRFANVKTEMARWLPRTDATTLRTRGKASAAKD